MKKMAKTDPELKKLDKALEVLKEKFEKNHKWRAWREGVGSAWIERALKALEVVKPTQEEMRMDIVEADLRVEYGLSEPEILVEQKEEVISALWKLLQIAKWTRGEKVEALDRLGEGE